MYTGSDVAVLIWQDVTLTFGEEKLSMKDTSRRLELTFQTGLLQVRQYEDESKTETLAVIPVSHPGYLDTWRDGRLAFGGPPGENRSLSCPCRFQSFGSNALLINFPPFHFSGEGEDEVSYQFLTGCLEKIQIQGRDVDLDLAVKHMSITSHSCPV